MVTRITAAQYRALVAGGALNRPQAPRAQGTHTWYHVPRGYLCVDEGCKLFIPRGFEAWGPVDIETVKRFSVAGTRRP